MAFTVSTEDYFSKNIFRIVSDKTTTSSWKSKQISLFVGMIFLKDVISNMTILLGKIETWTYLQKHIGSIVKFIKSLFKNIGFYRWYILYRLCGSRNRSGNGNGKNMLCQNKEKEIDLVDHSKNGTTFKCIMNLQLSEFEWESLFYLPELTFIKEQVLSYETISNDENRITERLVNVYYKNKENDFSILLDGSVVAKWKHYKSLDEKELESIVYNEELNGTSIVQVENILECISFDEFRNALDDILTGKNSVLRFDLVYTSFHVIVVGGKYMTWILAYGQTDLYALMYQIYYNHPKMSELLKYENNYSYRTIFILLLLTYDTQLQNIAESKKIPKIHYQGFLFGQKINITLSNYVCHMLEQYRVDENDVHSLFIELQKMPYAENVQKMMIQHLNITGKHENGTDVIIRKCEETKNKTSSLEKNVYPMQMCIHVDKKEEANLDTNMICIQKWNELLEKAKVIKESVEEHKKTQIELHHKNKITVPVYTLKCEIKNTMDIYSERRVPANESTVSNVSNEDKTKNVNGSNNASSHENDNNGNHHDDTLTIKKTYIKHIKRDFSTIFLPHEHKQQLINILHNFKNHIHKLQDVGLPNKLGIMLHGTPGTGKTSIINAIATYLEKDIYYINFNAIKSNEELGKIFHYIFKETNKGGIVVMEDIDAMTEIVHARKGDYEKLEGKREEKEENKKEEHDLLQFKKENNALMINIPDSLKKFVEKSEQILSYYTDQNEKLKEKIDHLQKEQKEKENGNGKGKGKGRSNSDFTLEYILNLLQGSLTLDGTIFIATTNHYNKLDPAFVRDGRFDYTLKLTFCVTQQLDDMFYSFFQEHIFPPILNLFESHKYITSTIFVHLSKYILTYNDHSHFVNSEAILEKYNTLCDAHEESDILYKKYQKQFIILYPFLKV